MGKQTKPTAKPAPVAKQKKAEYSNPLSLPDVMKSYQNDEPEVSILVLNQYCEIMEKAGKSHPKNGGGVFAWRDEVRNILAEKEQA